MDEFLKKIDELYVAKENLKTYLDDQPINFIRWRTGYYKGVSRYSTWKILLDESATKVCVRDRRGFHSVSKRLPQDVETVIAPKSTKDMLLSVTKADQVVAESALDAIAQEKYSK